MGVVGVLIMVVFILSAVLLCLIVLIQDDQGDAMGGLFGGGGGGGSAAFGARTGSVLTKLTSVLAAVFLLSAFSLAYLNRTPEAGDVVRRARLEELGGIQTGVWWVETPGETSQEASPVPESAPATVTAQEPPASLEAGGETSASGD